VTAEAETTFPAEIAVIAEPLRARLEQVLDDHLGAWTSIDPALEAPLLSIRDLVLAGGKRLRPAFCYWGFRAAGGAPEDPAVIDAGAAFELLHAFALIHDDVMDGSRLRRGAPTVQVDHAARHAQSRWRGEPRRFGDGVAILAGDLASVIADQLLAGVPRDAVDVWNQLRLEVNIGQYLDVLGAAEGTFDLERSRLIARYKSGKYTVERPLHFGAALGGRLADLAGPLTAYGEPLGEAFQLRDDLLGVFGDPQVTGKPVGDDLREGKPTMLLVLARQRAEPSDLALLDRVGSTDLDEQDVVGLRTYFERCGARAAVEGAIDQLTAEALARLDEAPISATVKQALGELGHYVGRRNH
jgi:geranylgeranyl diphosphate synthase type I